MNRGNDVFTELFTLRNEILIIIISEFPCDSGFTKCFFKIINVSRIGFRMEEEDRGTVPPATILRNDAIGEADIFL